MRIALVALVVAVAGVAAWLLLREPSVHDGLETSAERAVVDAPQGPVLHGAGKATAVVPRGTLAIRGRALRTNGKPAVGARVTASLDAVGEVARATAAADGTYALEGLSRTLHRVEAVLVEGEAEYGTYSWVAAGVDDLDLTLSLRPRTIVFRVLRPGGEPVPRFQARFVKPKGNQGLGLRGEGRVELRIGMGVGDDSVMDVAGGYLEVWGARDLQDRDLGLAPGRAGPLTGEEREVDVRLVPGPTIEGRVVGPAGPVGEAVSISLSVAKPKSDGVDLEEIFEKLLPGGLPGAQPTAPPALRPPFEGITVEAKTDAEGAFRIAFLGTDAAHTLQVSPPKGYLPPAKVQVRPGDPALEIALRVSVKVRLTVLGPDGEPRRGAHVHALPLKDATWSSSTETSTDAVGVAELVGLDPLLTYRLTVDPKGPPWMVHVPESVRKSLPPQEEPTPDPTAPPAAKHTVKEWRPADTTVRLRPAHTVSGLVLDTADRPVARASVSLRLDDEYQHETTDAEGRFRFEGLSPGKALLTASNRLAHEIWSVPEPSVPGDARLPAPRPESKPHEAEVVIAGDVSGVTLRVPATLTVTLRLAVPGKKGPPSLADLIGGMLTNTVKVLCWSRDRWVHGTTEFVNPMEAMGKKEQRIEVKGLEPGQRYAAWMVPVDGRYVYAEFAADAGTVDLERREGGSVSGRVLDLPAGSPFARVSIEDAQGREVEDVKTDREGRFEIRGLPPSVWTVHARHHTPGGPGLEAEGQVSTGASVELRLVPAGARPANLAEAAEEEEEVEVVR